MAPPKEPKAKEPKAASPKEPKAAAPKELKAETPREPKVAVAAPPPRLRKKYRDEVIPAMMKEFGYKNPLQVPRLEKVTVNVGLGEATQNAKVLDAAVSEIALITGQKPVVTRAKKAIANFKLREGVPIGCMVTLRRERMYEFLDRLINVALPRVRDFKGISDRSFDGRGNYSLGLREQLIFPEINPDKVDKPHGLSIAVVTTAQTDREGRALLKYLGMPFAGAGRD
jgi:large subunit ribosomal protein L5